MFPPIRLLFLVWFFYFFALNNEIVTLPETNSLPLVSTRLPRVEQWLGGGFKYFLVSPLILLGEDGSKLNSIFFQMGWFNHQLTMGFFQNFRKISKFLDSHRSNRLTPLTFPWGSYLYTFKNKDFKDYSYTSMCVPSDVCSVDVAGASKGMKLGSSGQIKIYAKDSKGLDIGSPSILSLRGGFKYHQKFQVPKISKMELLNLMRPFWGWVFPYISLAYSLYR